MKASSLMSRLRQEQSRQHLTPRKNRLAAFHLLRGTPLANHEGNSPIMHFVGLWDRLDDKQKAVAHVAKEFAQGDSPRAKLEQAHLVATAMERRHRKNRNMAVAPTVMDSLDGTIGSASCESLVAITCRCSPQASRDALVYTNRAAHFSRELAATRMARAGFHNAVIEGQRLAMHQAQMAWHLHVVEEVAMPLAACWQRPDLPADVRLLAASADHLAGALQSDTIAVLGDALEDVGGDGLLQMAREHCASRGPHLAGCWVLDWITGRR